MLSKINFNFSHLQIPMRQSFKHASAERKVTDSIWAKACRNGLIGIGEGCPRIYVTGETAQGGLEWLQRISSEVAKFTDSFEELNAWTLAHSECIDANPAAWCALELAVLDLLAREQNITVENLLDLPDVDGVFRYTAILGDDSIAATEAMLKKYLRMGFSDFKLKISGDPVRDQEKLALFKDSTVRIRIDANNVWAGKLDLAMNFLGSVPTPLFAVEEPLAPRDIAGLSKLSTELKLRVVLDESLLCVEDVKRFANFPGQWIGNIRVSKMGGVCRSLRVLRAMRDAGMQAIVGAQVGESSVLSRAALTIACKAGENLIAQEGAFGTFLLEQDAVEPVVMFGPNGVLTWPMTGSERVGWGLRKALG